MNQDISKILDGLLGGGPDPDPEQPSAPTMSAGHEDPEQPAADQENWWEDAIREDQDQPTAIPGMGTDISAEVETETTEDASEDEGDGWDPLLGTAPDKKEPEGTQSEDSEMAAIVASIVEVAP